MRLEAVAILMAIITDPSDLVYIVVGKHNGKEICDRLLKLFRLFNKKNEQRRYNYIVL